MIISITEHSESLRIFFFQSDITCQWQIGNLILDLFHSGEQGLYPLFLQNRKFTGNLIVLLVSPSLGRRLNNWQSTKWQLAGGWGKLRKTILSAYGSSKRPEVFYGLCYVCQHLLVTLIIYTR